VRKASTIFFLVLFVLAQTELHQLMKLPVLIEHFIEHRQLNSSITLLDFLKEHYQGHTVMDNDYQRDMQLPFKTADCLTAISFVFEEPVSIEFEQQVAEIRKEYNLHKGSFSSSQALHSIFQPPRHT
jgi:hypothetical protein